jgi:hypothetical protein
MPRPFYNGDRSGDGDGHGEKSDSALAFKEAVQAIPARVRAAASKRAGNKWFQMDWAERLALCDIWDDDDDVPDFPQRVPAATLAAGGHEMLNK